MTSSASPTQPTASEGKLTFTAFPFGLRVLFRILAPDGNFHYMIYQTGRACIVEQEIPDFLRIIDEDHRLLGIHHVDTLAAINPLVPEGPSDVKDPPNPT